MAEIYLRERSTVYQARIKVGSQIVRRSTGCNSPDAARQEAERLERELNASRLLPTDLMVIAATDRLFTRPRKKPYSEKTKKNYTTSLTNVVAVLGNFPLRLLDEETVTSYIKTKLKTGKTVQLRRDIAFLSTLMNHALDWECGVTRNPVRGVSKKDIHDAQQRDTYLQPHQVEKLLAACTTDRQRLFITLAVWTGMRHQEIMKLQWDEIDLRRGFIELSGERTKNSSPRTIPLRKEVIDTLSHTPKPERVGFVFKGTKEDQAQYNFAKSWSAIRRRAGMPKLRIHDLRHTFGSWLLQSGVPQKTAMDLLGHKTPIMTNRYSHNSPKSLKRAVERVKADTL